MELEKHEKAFVIAAIQVKTDKEKAEEKKQKAKRKAKRK